MGEQLEPSIKIRDHGFVVLDLLGFERQHSRVQPRQQIRHLGEPGKRAGTRRLDQSAIGGRQGGNRNANRWIREDGIRLRHAHECRRVMEVHDAAIGSNLDQLEVLFTHPALGAAPIQGHVVPFGPRGDALIR
jgi:hypothetical protein